MNMMDVSRIEEFLKALLKDTPHFLVEVTINKGDHLEVYIDSYKQFTHDDCVRVTRALQQEFGASLDAYHLTVSSAGLERPFRTEQQYHKNLGREVKVVTHDGKSYNGILEALSEKGITLRPLVTKKVGRKEVTETREPLDLPFTEIKLTTRLIRF